MAALFKGAVTMPSTSPARARAQAVVTKRTDPSPASALISPSLTWASDGPACNTSIVPGVLVQSAARSSLRTMAASPPRPCTALIMTSTSPTTSRRAFWRSSSWPISILAVISGPMPATSPRVTASKGSLLGWGCVIA
ncbi:hypothetical protein G6F63_015989 [Rhizopus arrhizus]|nr:hypothetical protein G6F63_015989 [Rhizopus arrhizus]